MESRGSTEQRGGAAAIVSALVVRAGLLLSLWGALGNGAALGSWGLPVALLAALLSLHRVPAQTGRTRALLRFPAQLPFLAREALLSGWDVARRALAPGPRLDPGFLEVPLEEGKAATRLALAYAFTLMPGTLTVRLEPAAMTLHVIDCALPNQARAQELEARLATVFRGSAP